MTTINTMFAENTNGAETTSGRSLSGTAQLTNLATELGNKVMTFVNDGLNNEEIVNDLPIADSYKRMLAASKTDHGAMDALIEASGVLNFIADSVEFIKELDDATVEGMLKSQQSKRSRAKGKVMTKDNYMAMLTGAIAENLIRVATGKEKQAARRGTGEVNYTDEALKKLADDQDALRKELRNIQSKKSIMKSKDGFDEESDGWKNLLAAEEALKAIRIAGASGTTKVVEVDTTKSALAAIIEGMDWNDQKAWPRKALVSLLEAIKELTLVTEPAAENVEPDDNSGDDDDYSCHKCGAKDIRNCTCEKPDDNSGDNNESQPDIGEDFYGRNE